MDDKERWLPQVIFLLGEMLSRLEEVCVFQFGEYIPSLKQT